MLLFHSYYWNDCICSSWRGAVVLWFLLSAFHIKTSHSALGVPEEKECTTAPRKLRLFRFHFPVGGKDKTESHGTLSFCSLECQSKNPGFQKLEKIRKYLMKEWEMTIFMWVKARSMRMGCFLEALAEGTALCSHHPKLLSDLSKQKFVIELTGCLWKHPHTGFLLIQMKTEYCC